MNKNLIPCLSVMSKSRLSQKYLLLLTMVFGLFFVSCGSKRAALIYDPVEVKQLSGQMGFSIDNTDEHIPLYAEVSMWLGVPYRYAGLSRRGVDCSGFVYCIYQNVYGKNVPRATSDLEKKSHKVSKHKLKTGDLVFFATLGNKNNISHVGIYLKDGYFVHASTSRGVIVSSLDEKYYVQAWKKGGRLK